MGSYQNYHVRLGNGALVKITDNCPVNKRIFRVGNGHLSALINIVHIFYENLKIFKKRHVQWWVCRFLVRISENHSANALNCSGGTPG